MTLAVGFFDGVHLGHRRILAEADAAITFDVHPLAVLAPDRAPPLLTTLAARTRLIAAALTPAAAAAEPPVRTFAFDRALADLSPDGFVRRLRDAFPGLDSIRCGAGWRFGRGGSGDADFLRGCGLAVTESPLVDFAGAPVSSTRIRRALAAGDAELAAGMLGRAWSVSGTVAKGKGMGRRLGFPTLNLTAVAADRRLLPHGVYRVAVPPFGDGIANWGVAPTMGDRAWRTETLEIHFPHAPAGSAWPEAGTETEVGFLGFVRPERRFGSVAELRAQIAADVRTAFADAAAPARDSCGT